MGEDHVDSIVKQLFDLKHIHDPEVVHAKAEDLLWEAAPYEIRQAYLSVKLAQPWWACG
jgi:hypothetical protein